MSINPSPLTSPAEAHALSPERVVKRKSESCARAKVETRRIETIKRIIKKYFIKCLLSIQI
jgi:hypothetical protein